jgi:Mg-chelatase subunit ChlD
VRGAVHASFGEVDGRATGTLAAAARVAGTIAASLALLGPVIGERVTTVPERDLEILVVVDVSRSMGVDTLGLTRLDHGRTALHGLLGWVQGARVGMTVVGSQAQPVLPPTRDLEVVRLYLDALEPGAFSREGSSATAIDEAFAAWEPEGPAAAVIVSDGEWWGGPVLAEGEPVPTWVLWTGSPVRGLVAGGGVSLARVDPLGELARSAGGRLISADDLAAVGQLGGELAGRARTLASETERSEPVDGGPLLAGGAAFLLFVSSMLRRRG